MDSCGRFVFASQTPAVFRWIKLLTVVWCAATICLLSPPKIMLAQDSDDPEIATLIGQLGSDRFQQREAAQRALVEHGAAALNALDAARFSDDNEIRFRAERIADIVRQESLDRVLAAFIEGDSSGESLSGWKEFAKIVQDTPNSRQMFSQMYRRNSSLLMAMKSDPERLSTEYRRVVAQVESRNYYWSGIVQPLASMLLIGCQDSIELSRLAYSDTSHTIKTCLAISQPMTASLIASSGYQPEIKLLLEEWLQRRPAKGNRMLLDAQLAVIQRYELKSLLPVVFAAIENESNGLSTQAEAIMALCAIGDEALVGRLAPLFADQQMVASTATGEADSETLDVQLRDVALATAIYLTNQKYTDFGFALPAALDGQRIAVRQAGFTSQATREQAFQKWKEQGNQ